MCEKSNQTEQIVIGMYKHGKLIDFHTKKGGVTFCAKNAR